MTKIINNNNDIVYESKIPMWFWYTVFTFQGIIIGVLLSF
jgi:hypothetical protein